MKTKLSNKKHNLHVDFAVRRSTKLFNTIGKTDEVINLTEGQDNADVPGMIRLLIMLLLLFMSVITFIYY